jgi:hypothetical protein
MKMGAGLFWGIILIVIGLSIILRVAFDISIFRIVIAVVLILIGVKMLIGKPVVQSEGHENHVVFGEKTNTADPLDGTEYNTVFGKTVYDFRNMKPLTQPRTKIKFNTVFGSNDIILPPGLPVKIKSDAVFATASMPNGNTVAFGSTNFEANTEITDSAVLIIENDVVFGASFVRQ